MQGRFQKSRDKGRQKVFNCHSATPGHFPSSYNRKLFMYALGYVRQIRKHFVY
ncbi:MAG: hypothetical protein JWO06_3162 [Bacteroidota bacterium]|nr:hypothetical protein [Bacteroidota bacterium]